MSVGRCGFCCDRKAWAACAQSFTLWQQATIEITRRDHSIFACSRHIYMGVVLHALPVCGESHVERNANGEVARTAVALWPAGLMTVFAGIHSQVVRFDATADRSRHLSWGHDHGLAPQQQEASRTTYHCDWDRDLCRPRAEKPWTEVVMIRIMCLFVASRVSRQA